MRDAAGIDVTATGAVHAPSTPSRWLPTGGNSANARRHTTACLAEARSNSTTTGNRPWLVVQWIQINAPEKRDILKELDRNQGQRKTSLPSPSGNDRARTGGRGALMLKTGGARTRCLVIRRRETWFLSGRTVARTAQWNERSGLRYWIASATCDADSVAGERRPGRRWCG
jgi:hypothetical protein